MRRNMLLQAALVIILLLVNSWAFAERKQREKFADELGSAVASTWFELLYDVVKAENTPPPPASRVYGITAVALYESIVAGTNENRSLVGQLNGLISVPEPKKTTAHRWLTVANAAIANAIRGLYPTISPASLDAINKLEEKFGAQYQAQVPREEYERSVIHGQAVATAIL